MNLFSAFLLAMCTIGCFADPAVKVGIKGKCPDVNFVEDFDPAKYIGKWFAVKETGKETPCVFYELTEIEVNHYSAKVEPKGLTMEFKKNDDEDYAKGFTVSIPVNPYMHGGVLKVFATDYTNYAGVYTCKYNDVDDVYYQSISFWGRTNTLSDEVIKSLSETLSKYEVDESDVKFVKQDECEVV